MVSSKRFAGSGRLDANTIAVICLRIVLALTIIVAVYVKEWFWVIGSMSFFFIGLIPATLHHDINEMLPWPIELLIAAVCALNMGGTLLNAYYNVPLYNETMQFLFSILVAFVAFAMVYILNENWTGLNLDKYALVYVVVTTTITGLVIYEFIKYIGFFGPRANSVETMILSLLVGIIGGILMGILGMFLVDTGRFDPLVKDIEEEIDEQLIHRNPYAPGVVDGYKIAMAEKKADYFSHKAKKIGVKALTYSEPKKVGWAIERTERALSKADKAGADAMLAMLNAVEHKKNAREKASLKEGLKRSDVLSEHLVYGEETQE